MPAERFHQVVLRHLDLLIPLLIACGDTVQGLQVTFDSQVGAKAERIVQLLVQFLRNLGFAVRIHFYNL